MRVVLTTVGTSIFTNYMNEEVVQVLKDANKNSPVNATFKKLLNKGAVEKDDYFSETSEIKENIKDLWLKGIRKESGEWTIKDSSINFDASAEIKSLVKLKEKYGSDLKVYLLATDTLLSLAAAELIKEFFEENNSGIEFKNISVIKGLQVKDFKSFEKEGLPNLIQEFKTIRERNLLSITDKKLNNFISKADKNEFISIPHNRREELYSILNELKNRVLSVDALNNKLRDFSDKQKETITINATDFTKLCFNITGGYKAVIPYLTIIGQLYGTDVNYIYEESNELITIPQLPVQFDWSKSSRYFDFLGAQEWTWFDRDEKKIIEEMKNQQLIRLKESNQYKVTALGKLFHDYIEENFDSANRVLGHYVEYKLFEYFVRNPYKDYINVVHSRNLTSEDENCEIDLVLSKTREENSPFVAVECKAFQQAKKLEKQLERQIRVFKSSNHVPDEYILFVYIDKDKTKYNSMDDLNLQSLKQLFERQLPSCNFIVKYTSEINLRTSLRNPNPYQNFIKKKFEDKDIKDFSF